jgi:hypothetical protein
VSGRSVANSGERLLMGAAVKGSDDTLQSGWLLDFNLLVTLVTQTS